MELDERLLSDCLERPGPGEDHGLARHRERNLLEHDQAERVAGNVHPLPEACRRNQHRVASAPKGIENRALRRLSLHEHLPPGKHLHEQAMELSHGAKRRREHECAPAGDLHQLGNPIRGTAREGWIARIGQVPWEIKEGSLRVVEGGGHDQLGHRDPVAREPEARSDEAECLRPGLPALAARERRGGQHDGRDGLEQARTEEARQVHRRRAQGRRPSPGVEPGNAARRSVHYGSQILP